MFEKEFRKPTTISEFRKTSWEELLNFEKQLRKNNSGEKKNIGKRMLEKKRMWEKEYWEKKNVGNQVKLVKNQVKSSKIRLGGL